MKNPLRPVAVRAVLIGLALMSSLFALPASAAPQHVIVTLPVGARAPEKFSETLASWRQSGQVSNVLWLDSAQKDDAGFTTLVTLEFPSEGSYDAWVKEGAPKLVAPLVVKQADLLTKGELTPRDSNKSVFKVNVYQTTTTPEKYAEFAKGYITPLMEGQRAAKVLVSYAMYLGRDPAGKGQSVLVMEYRDSLAFERSTAVKEDVRTRLASNHPTYPKLHETKDNLRSDVSETLAAYTELPPPQLPGLPSYKPEVKIVGGLRIVGSELKNAVAQLAEGFQKFHPEAKVTTSHIPSSEGGIAGLYFDVSDVAPMGDDAKITDLMPFYNTFGYMPTEISVATGGYEKRGSLFAWAIVVNKDNPLNEISVDELERVFGAERTGGWELVNDNYLYTSKYARGPETNIRKWGQLGVKGELANKEIETFG